jgi:hypothetical protein
MPRKYISLLLFISLMICFHCRKAVAESPLRPEYKQCLDSHEDNASLWQCGSSEIAYQRTILDDLLNSLYSDKAMPHEGTLKHLQTDQAAWEDWYKTACNYELDFGHLEGVLSYPPCKIQIIQERIDQLKSLQASLDYKPLSHKKNR